MADLLDQQLDDGGWNCATRTEKGKHSSFHTSIQALEALHEYAEAEAGALETNGARRRGREFFLAAPAVPVAPHGAVAIRGSTRFPAFPEWHFDVLRGLEHFAAVGAPRDERLADAVEVVRAGSAEGRPLADVRRLPGSAVVRAGAAGPSRWNTCRVLAVLDWWEA